MRAPSGTSKGKVAPGGQRVYDRIVVEDVCSLGPAPCLQCARNGIAVAQASCP